MAPALSDAAAIGGALLGALALVALVAALYAARAAGRRRLLAPVAERLGGHLVVPALLEPPVLELPLRGRRLRLCWRKEGRGSCEALELDCPLAPSMHCELRPRAGWPQPTPAWGTGDASFDAMFAIVAGEPAARVRGFLNAQVRRSLLQLCGPRRDRLIVCLIDARGLSLRRMRPFRRPDELTAFIAAARPVYEQFIGLVQAR